MLCDNSHLQRTFCIASAFISVADRLPIGNFAFRESRFRIALIMHAALSASVQRSPRCLSSGFSLRQRLGLGDFVGVFLEDGRDGGDH